MITPKLMPGIVLRKRVWYGLFGVLVLLCSLPVTAKPLYVIDDFVFSIEATIKTYDVFLNGTIDFVTDNVIEARCSGPADLAFTPDGRYMFTVSGGSAWVQVVDTVTMTVGNEAFVSGTKNLDFSGEDFSGVAFDPGRNLVYSVDRGQNKLYVHHWDRDSASLTLAQNGRITLPGTTTRDIALDLTHDLLFVSNGTNQVHVFNLSDWSLNKTIMLGRNIDRIDLDERNQLLYLGTAEMSGTPYLLQYDLLTSLTRTHMIEEHGFIVGIAVDDSTSLIYVATRNPVYAEEANRIDVFTGDLVVIDHEQVDGYVNGLGLPVEGVSYSPLAITKRIVSGAELIGGVHYASGGDVVTYEVCFENRSAGPVGNVEVVDDLPEEAIYLGRTCLGLTPIC